MRGKKRIAGLLLAMAVALLPTGCASHGNSQAGEGSSGLQQESANKVQTVKEDGTGKASGRFLESEVSLSKKIRNIRAFVQLEDKSLEAVGADGEKNYYILTSKDQGKNWETTLVKGLEKEYLPQVAIAPDGRAAFLGYAKEKKGKAWIADKKGKTKAFSFRLSGGNTDNQVCQTLYDRQGNLVILDSSGSLLKLNPSDGTCREAFKAKGIKINYFSVAGNLLLAIHKDGVLLFDTEDEKKLDAEGVLDDLIKKNAKFASVDTDSGAPIVFSGTDGDGQIMYANENGIFQYMRGGSVAEQLVEGSLTSLGNGGIIFLSMAVLDADHIFLAVNDEEGNKILQYSYDETVAAVPEKEITVYALDESDVLRKAVTLFQKKYPDVYVHLEFGLSGEDGVTLEDALSVLNTDILAGKGPDVLILDAMPLQSYIEKGILADISDVVNAVEQEDGIFSNIKEGSMQDGKIYAMPARFLLSVAEGDKETVKSGGSLEALAKRARQLKDQDKKATITPSKGTMTLLRDFYYADSATWVNEENLLDGEAVKAYLKAAKDLYDVDSHSKEKDYINASKGDGTFEGTKSGTNNSSGLISNESRMAFGSLADMFDFQSMVSTWAQTKAGYCLLNHEKVKSYIPYLLAGVTEGGNVDIAKKFVKELLGKKCENDAFNGFPVNRAAYQKLCEKKMDDPAVKEGMSISFGAENGKKYGFDFVNLTQEQVDSLTGWIESLEKPALTDRVIQEIVLGQGDKYLLGEQGLDETVEAVLKKVNLYLAE